MPQLLTTMKRYELLNATRPDPSKLIAQGELSRAEGMLSDAVDFFEKAGQTDALAAMIPLAIQEGDYFLYNRLTRMLDRTPDGEELDQLADQAEKLGKFRYAEQARARRSPQDPVPQPEP